MKPFNLDTLLNLKDLEIAQLAHHLRPIFGLVFPLSGHRNLYAKWLQSSQSGEQLSSIVRFWVLVPGVLLTMAAMAIATTATLHNALQ